MFSRVFLAAGVAALAITAPASAQKGGHGGGKGGGQPAAAQGGGGGGHGNGGGKANRGGGGDGGQAVVQGGGGGRGHGGGFQAPQQRVERQQMRQQSRGFERQQMRRVEREQARGFERQQARQIERQQARGFERQQAREGERQGGFERQQARQFERQQAPGLERKQARQVERQQARSFERQRGFNHQQAKIAERQQMRMNRAQQKLANQQQLAAQQFRDQQFGGKDQRFTNRAFADGNWAPAYQTFAYNDVQVVPYQQVTRFVGSPLSALTGFTLNPLPASIQYLYPETDDYYYRYGDGYLYQVDRGDNLIASLLPLLGGGFMPGQYLPASYMNSYVPSYYGFNSFYPDYNDVCNRYYNGVIYQVDCDDGYVENVLPMYAGGYGVGQLLPAAYSTYNVPVQYRSMYYDTPDYGYWYSPGAIYQYDNRSSMITSVAALLSPGFSIGQPLPMGYDVYNVPYEYRQTYYDTNDAWYRYNNGYIYQVDPTTQLVTAIVASLLA